MPVSHPPDNAEWGGWISQHYVPKEGGAADGIWDSLVYSWHWMRSPLAAHSKPGAEPWGISQTESGRGANQIQHGRSKRKTRKPRGQVFWEARDPKQNKTKKMLMGWNYVSDSEHGSFRKSWLEWVQGKMRCEEVQTANVNYSLQESGSQAEQKNSALVGGVCSLRGGVLFSLR